MRATVRFASKNLNRLYSHSKKSANAGICVLDTIIYYLQRKMLSLVVVTAANYRNCGERTSSAAEVDPDGGGTNNY